MADSPAPQIIRSQRYRGTNIPVPQHPVELSAARDIRSLANHDVLVQPAPLQDQASRHEQLAQQGLHGFTANSALDMIAPEKHLGYLSTSALIVNRVVGSGIFALPTTVLALVGSKGAGLFVWTLGSLMTVSGAIVYLEYGIRFPLTGGELHYINLVWRKPKKMLTYAYAIMFTILSGSQGNALTFGSSVLIAATPAGTPVNRSLQKFIGILLTALVCLSQAYSRTFNVHLSNAFAAYKVALLTFICVTGWISLGGIRADAAKAIDSSYGKENLQDAFAGTLTRGYNWGLALLVTDRAFLGYENANLVLEEVRRPPGDEARVFRRAAKVTILLLCFLYVMFNVAIYSACSKDELMETSDVLSLFFKKVFGESIRGRQASGVLVALSAAGNVVAYSYSSVKVKQEVARMGILPVPEFWAKSTRGGTSGPAILLHFVFTTIFILASPLDNANGYLAISTLFTYTRTWVGILLGLGLLAASKLSAFQKPSEKWRPASTRGGFFIVTPLTTLYIAANVFILVLCWFPSNLQSDLQTKSSILPTYVGPAVGTAVSVFGIVYWGWDLHILPQLGYRMVVKAERRDDLVVHMQFQRYVSGFAMTVWHAVDQVYIKIQQLRMARRQVHAHSRTD